MERVPSAPFLVAATVLLAACDATRTTTPSDDATGPAGMAIVDGRSGGNPHFFWVGRIGGDPPPGGTFDPTLLEQVRVDICPISAGVCVSPMIAFFTSRSGSDSERIGLDAPNEQYSVLWRAGQYGLDEAVDYRIIVLLNGSPIGHADIDVFSGGMRRRHTNDLISLNSNGSLPIQFRIEQGAKGDRFALVTAGNGHTCGVTVMHVGYCWGQAIYGKLGNGDPNVNRAIPTLIAGLQFKTVNAGSNFTCAVTISNEPYCWGYGADGRLGNGSTIDRSTLTPVAGALEVAQLAPGGNHVCALTRQGAAFCWGLGSSGQLGDGLGVSSTTPVQAVEAPVFASVTAGNFHSCALTSQGEAYCWGENSYGQLGTGSASGNATMPTPVAGGLVFRTISAGSHFTCGVTFANEGYCWGIGTAGVLGNGSVSSRSSPTPVSGGIAFTSISAGYSLAACGVAIDGTAYCWGWGNQGQLGNGDGADRGVPTRVAGEHLFASIRVGYIHTCGTTTSGAAYCWGTGSFGQLGNGDFSNRSVPTAVAGL